MGIHVHTRRPVFFTDYEDQNELEIPTDLTTLDDEALGALHTQATEAFDAIYQNGEVALSEADLAAMQALTDGIEAMNAERGTREGVAQERRDAAAELAARLAPPADEAEDAEGGDEDEEGDAEEDAEAETVEVEGEVLEEDSLAASGARPTRINLAGLRSRQRAPRPTAEADAGPSMRDIVMAAPDVPGFSNGQGMDFADLGRAVDSRLTGFKTGPYEAAAKQNKHIRQQFGVAVIKKHFDSGLIIEDDSPSHVEQVLARAVDESRLPQGSLVASGGWCAPSETVYDLFELESRDGLLSLPEVNISRGGIRWTQGPDFAAIFAETGFCYTEAEDIIGDYDGAGGGSKPCFHVDCPPFLEERLDLCGVCITAGLLQQRGYPEVISRTIRGALTAHAHRMSANKINALVAGSTAVALPADQVGALAPVLTAIELQVEHYRYTHRLRRGVSLEAIFPFWVRGAIRSDLSRRLGVDLISVTDQQINGWFASRGINPQFVYNWQDINTTAASGFTAWPTEVDFLLYAAGTWVAGGSDIITLDTVYDSTMLGQNDYTALFTEEGWLVTKRGHDSRVVTVPICPTGDTGGGVLIDCDGSAGA